MTDVTRQKIFEKLHLLDKYLVYLGKLKKEIKSKEIFLADFHLFGSVERYLQLSCQIIVDALGLVIIEENLEKPGSRMEQISLLYNNKIISESLASKLEDMAKFRNILVHEYGEIDHAKVYKNFLSKIEDFQIFKKEILNWLSNKQ